MSDSLRVLLLVFCGLILAACTPMEWRRNGEVASINSEEYLLCRNRATLDGMRYMPFPGMYSYPVIGRDRLGRSIALMQPWSHSDQMMREHMSLMLCMTGKGYELLPVAPAAIKAP